MQFASPEVLWCLRLVVAMFLFEYGQAELLHAAASDDFCSV